MKTKLIFLVLLIVCFSCGTNNKPVSDAQKEKIKGEVKEVVNNEFKSCEEANFDNAINQFMDTPDFAYIMNGTIFSYKQLVDGIKPMFGMLVNQKVTITEEKYAVLDNSSVVYTSNCKFLMNYKDGHSVLADPMALQFIFKKINNDWKIIYGVESFVEQNVKNTETSKELNQFELSKQFIGSWKCDIGKDTTLFYDIKSYGTGFEGFMKFVTKGKVYGEVKRLCGYNKDLDKYIFASLGKGEDVVLIANWFTSSNKLEAVHYSDISNPDKASWKVEVEFKSQDKYIETLILENKPVWSGTYTRIK